VASDDVLPVLDVVDVTVAANGCDDWSGRQAEPNADGTDGPLATLAGARDAVRKLKKRGEHPNPVRVVLRGGVHFLDEPVVFGPADSGTRECPVTIAAAEGERAVVSGGRRIDDWRVRKLRGKTVWVADMPEVRRGKWRFRQLFVDGERAARTRLPRKGFYRIEALPDVKPTTRYNAGQRRMVFRKGDVQRWTNLGDVEIVALSRWIENRMGVKDVDLRTRTVTFDRKSMHNLTDESTGGGTQYFVENVFEALDTPGQWYLDRPAGKLYYMPKRGQTPDSTEVIVPCLPELLRLEGASAKKKVEYIHIEGLQLSHVEFSIPPKLAGYNQACNGVTGAVVYANAHRCTMTGCEVSHVGGYGVEILDGCVDVELRHTTVCDLGAGGVKPWHGSQRSTIADCVVCDGGHIFPSGVGILIGASGANKVLHNHIHDFYYSGISVGWTWGYQDSGHAFGNVVEYNHVHDIGHGWLSDMGGIYTLGASTGTRIRFNVFHHVESRGYGGWGIYLDEGSTDVLVEKNLTYRTKSSGFNQHYGKNNVVQNNIFALAREYQFNRTRIEAHRSLVFRRNIIYFRQGKFFRADSAEQGCEFERNLYWDATGRPIRFAGKDLAQWQGLGMDAGTVIADPLFVDPEAGDFRFRPGAPVAAIGFEPFDLSGVGPRPRQCNRVPGERPA
jgi:glycosyl hydrolase family 141/parallel beta helix pectate lyase-like protein